MWNLKSIKNPSLIISSILIILSFVSCSKKEPCDQLGPDMISIKLVDANNNLLIGTQYLNDSIRFIRNDQIQTIQISDGTIIYLHSPSDNIYTSTYFLYLSQNDTDTINFKTYSYETDCGTWYRCNGLTYNSKNIFPVPNTVIAFKITKE